MALAITPDNAREASAAAQRLLNDPFLREALDEQVMRHADVAQRGQTVELREYSRMRVQAIMDLRADLAAVLESWNSQAQMQRQAQAHE